jgi:hypothetical protein
MKFYKTKKKEEYLIPLEYVNSKMIYQNQNNKDHLKIVESKLKKKITKKKYFFMILHDLQIHQIYTFDF